MFFFRVRCFFEKLSSKLNKFAILSALESCGKDVIIHGSVSIENPKQIMIGNNVKILKGVTIKSRCYQSKPSIVFGENVKIHEYSCIDDYGGSILIGNNTGIGHLCVIAGHGGLSIGKDCMIAGCTYIIPADHTFDNLNGLFVNQPETKKGINIGDNVWIGAGCIILDGVTIGSNTVIGAGSVVTNNIPSGVLAFGNPAKVQRELKC